MIHDINGHTGGSSFRNISDTRPRSKPGYKNPQHIYHASRSVKSDTERGMESLGLAKPAVGNQGLWGYSRDAIYSVSRRRCWWYVRSEDGGQPYHVKSILYTDAVACRVAGRALQLRSDHQGKKRRAHKRNRNKHASSSNSRTPPTTTNSSSCDRKGNTNTVNRMKDEGFNKH